MKALNSSLIKIIIAGMVFLFSCSNIKRINPFDSEGENYFPLPIDSLCILLDTQNVFLKWNRPVAGKGEKFSVLRADSFDYRHNDFDFKLIEQLFDTFFTESHKFRINDSAMRCISYQIRTPFDAHNFSFSDTVEIRIFNVKPEQVFSPFLVDLSSMANQYNIYEIISFYKIKEHDIITSVYPYTYLPVDSSRINSFIILRVEPEGGDLSQQTHITYFCGFVDSSLF